VAVLATDRVEKCHHTEKATSHERTAPPTATQPKWCKAVAAVKAAAVKGYDSGEELIEQEEYEEDHADEERMFTMMDHLLARLRKGLLH
jgi:hypothetical protein